MDANIWSAKKEEADREERKLGHKYYQVQANEWKEKYESAKKSSSDCCECEKLKKELKELKEKHLRLKKKFLEDF